MTQLTFTIEVDFDHRTTAKFVKEVNDDLIFLVKKYMKQQIDNDESIKIKIEAEEKNEQV